MAEIRRCPQCDRELPADAPAGLCPDCLLKLGVQGDPSGEQIDETVDAPAPAASPGGFVPPALAELAARFPQLEIIELLGRGGMGAVYKARQKKLDRLVALKILPPHLGKDPNFADRFAREALALARLNHPHIVTVYDVGDADGMFYLVMEFVDGVNLRQTIKSGRLSPEEALAVVPQICDALQFAHEEGIVHRDIKPENVLLDKKGRVKIADFGLAKLLGQSAAGPQLTISHQVMGTLHYMAPEQMERPLEVDHRADIYSLGVVFYELLTGELPLGRFDPPSRKVQVTVELDKVVLRALEKEVDRRYQHASEVTTDIERIRSSQTVHEAAGGAERKPSMAGAAPQAAGRRWPAVSMVLALLFLLMVFVPWQVPEAVKSSFRDEQRWDELRVSFGASYDRSVVSRLWCYDSSLHLSLGDVTAVIPNGLLVLAVVVIAACALVRGATGKTWPLIVQGLVALYACLHMIALLVLMFQVGMNIQLVPVLMAVALGLLALIPPLVGLQWTARLALAQRPVVQLKIAAAGIMLVAGGLFLLLAGNFVMLAVIFLQGRGPVGMPLAPIAFCAALLLLSGFVTFCGWSMFRLESERLARIASILGPPFGLWGLWLLTRTEVRTAFQQPADDADDALDSAPLPTATQHPVQEAKPLSTQETAARRVRGPAIGLMIVGIVDVAAILIPLLAAFSMTTATRPGDRVMAAVGPAYSGWALFAQDAEHPPFDHAESTSDYPVLTWSAVGIVLAMLVCVPISGVLILGGLKMRQLELYALAVLASVLAMLPCHPGFLIGLPIGLWSLMVLFRPEVRAAFADNAAT